MHDVLVSFGLFMYLCLSEGKDLYISPGEAVIDVSVLLGTEALRVPCANGEGYV